MPDEADSLPATLAEAVGVAAARWPDRTAWTFDPGGHWTGLSAATAEGTRANLSK